MPLRDTLFQPVDIGSLRLPNRLAMAPMTREFAPGGMPGADVAAYYARRAAGGIGLIITEGMAVSAVGAHDGPVPHLFSAQARPAIAGIAAAVHAAGGLVMPQLWHVGLQDSPTQVNPATVKQRPRRVGPSGISANGATAGEAMDDRAIADTIADFADAAAVSQAAGFDGVELHAAHGYLPDQFLWQRTNRRDDRYGIADRSRFLAELIAACRDAVGKTYPIVVRLSQWKSSDYAARLAETPEALQALLAPLVDAGATAFHCSTRRFWEAGFAGEARTLAGWMRHLGGVPVIAVGSMTLASDFKDGKSEVTGGIADSAARGDDVDRAARLIADGEFDVIAIGRAPIANPDWATLVRAGRQDALRPFAKEMLAALD